MDVHVPYAITIALLLRDVDVLTAQEDGSRRLEDAALLDRATILGRIMFTRDDDLLREGTVRQKRGETFSGIIYAHRRASASSRTRTLPRFQLPLYGARRLERGLRASLFPGNLGKCPQRFIYSLGIRKCRGHVGIEQHKCCAGGRTLEILASHSAF